MELNLPDLRGQEPEDAKQQLRQLIRSARDRLSDSQVSQAGQEIRDRVLEFATDFHTIACYVSVKKEPPTLDLIEALYQQGKRLLVPKLGSKLNRDWAFYAGRDDLANRSPNRPMEPSGDALDSSALAAVDLVITPALAVDRQGNRLGQGGGWYDRALPYVQKQAILLSVRDSVPPTSTPLSSRTIICPRPKLGVDRSTRTWWPRC